jgi:hypothetical protein
LFGITSFNTGMAAVMIGFVDVIHFLVAIRLFIFSNAKAVLYLMVP